MTCSRFQAELVAVLASGDDDPRRKELIRSLRRHARACDACASGPELLEWAALERSERAGDTAPGPDDPYWTDFDARLADRIALDRTSRLRRLRVGAAAAALAGLGLLVTWLLLPGSERVRVAGAPDGQDPAWLTAELDELDGFLELPDGWAGFDLDPRDSDAELAQEDLGSLFPPTDDLDAGARQRLLEWLRLQASGAGRGPA